MNYRNSKGYSDPTAGQALENITREENRVKPGRWIKSYVWIPGARCGRRITGRKGLQNSYPAEKTGPGEPRGTDADPGGGAVLPVQVVPDVDGHRPG